MGNDQLRTLSSESKLVVGLVSGAEFVNHMYIVLLPPILGLLTVDFGVSLAVLGLAMGAQRVSTTVCQLPFGYVSDRYGRVLGLGLALAIGSVGVFVVALAPSIPVLFAGMAIIGVGIAGHHPSHYPLLAGAVPESVRGRAFSVRGFAGALGFGTPAALITAVLALPDTTWRHALGLTGALGLVYCAIAVVGLRRFAGDTVTAVDAQTTSGDAPDGSLRDRVVSELGAVLASPPILAIALLSFVWAVASNGITAYTVVHLTDGYGLALETANLTFTAMFVAGACMALLGGALVDRFSAGSVLVTTFLVVGVLVSVFATLLVPVAVVIPFAVLIGGFRSFGGPARSKLIDTFSERATLGRSFALMTVGMMLGGAVGPSVFGVLIERLGLRLAFGGVAAVAFLAALLAVWVVVTYTDHDISLGNTPSAS